MLHSTVLHNTVRMVQVGEILILEGYLPETRLGCGYSQALCKSARGSTAGQAGGLQVNSWGGKQADGQELTVCGFVWTLPLVGPQANCSTSPRFVVLSFLKEWKEYLTSAIVVRSRRIKI